MQVYSAHSQSIFLLCIRSRWGLMSSLIHCWWTALIFRWDIPVMLSQIYTYIKTTLVCNTNTNLQVTCFTFSIKPSLDLFIIKSCSKNLHLRVEFMYFNICFYDVYCKGMRSKTHMQVQVLFVWLMKRNKSDDGLIENPKLVTRRFEIVLCMTVVWRYVYH